MGLSRASALRSHARQVAAHLSGAVCLSRGIALDALSARLRAKALFSTQRKWEAVTSPTLLPAVPGRPPCAILAPNDCTAPARTCLVFEESLDAGGLAALLDLWLHADRLVRHFDLPQY